MKLLSLISGGIDSPIAAHLMLEKEHDVEFVHFDLQPFGDGSSLRKTKLLVEKLSGIHRKKLKLHILPHGEFLVKVLQKCEHKQACVLCRRGMLRAAEKLAEKIKADALLTGENLAQVASQTLDNLYVEEQAVKIPIIRPLIAFNKQEIIDIASRIGTYDISILPGQCCGAVPRYPETHANLRKVEAEEEKIQDAENTSRESDWQSHTLP